MVWALCSVWVFSGVALAEEDALALARQEVAALAEATEDPALREGLARIDAHLVALQDVPVVEPPETPVAPAGPLPLPVPPGTPPCPDDEYQALKARVADQPFARDKIVALEAATARQHFSVVQVIGLLEILDFGSDKVQAAALLHPRVVDPAGFDQVYEALVFETDRDALRGLIED